MKKLCFLVGFLRMCLCECNVINLSTSFTVLVAHSRIPCFFFNAWGRDDLY